MEKLIECVPNFSEGRDSQIINAIAAEMEKVEGVKLLDVDAGKATNRTVMTLVGTPDRVIEAAFNGIKRASELIDMSKHKGEHPRMGATDVCPLIPLSGVGIVEAVTYANKLAERVGKELNIPVYLYEYAQSDKQRSNLSVIREGEYEGFSKKIKLPEWKPDYGPSEFPAHAGATVIGVRELLVAYNVNLNTTSVRRANSVAFDVRERGRVVKDDKGIDKNVPGTLKEVKAIGWYIEEYGQAQVSMNLTNIKVTSVHEAFEEVCKSAQSRGMRVTGSELVGLIPLQSMLDAGKHFLRKQKRSAGVSEKELIRIAIKTMGLDELNEFDPEKKIIEFRMQKADSRRLIADSLLDFADTTASESAAPGGGSVSAYLGALGASLGTMVANLSAAKNGWEDHILEFSDWAEKGQKLKDKLLKAVDEDTEAFNMIMNAFSLPKNTDIDKAVRKEAISKATLKAIDVPYKVMQISLDSMELIGAMAQDGNPNSVSDAGVGALCARSAVIGAHLNVKINASGIADKASIQHILDDAFEIEKRAVKLEEDILKIVNKVINKG